MSIGSNKFGHLFQWTTFGESHGPAMGVVIDGCPAGLEVNQALLLTNLAKRRPGAGNLLNADVVSQRNEEDVPKILSGVFENKTLGSPIAVIVENTNQRTEDYEDLKDKVRIGHADDLWKSKYGMNDYRGGGRASARETLNWVIAGSFAQMFCLSQKNDLHVLANLIKVGELKVQSLADPQLVHMLGEAKVDGESYGATISLEIKNPNKNLGEPIFKKIKSELAHAFMSINACTAVELGDGLVLSESKGTQVHKVLNDKQYGGIRGGITTGDTISFRLFFKPTSSIQDVAKKGRHDPCVAIRALPIVEAMTWNVLADQILMQRLNKV